MFLKFIFWFTLVANILDGIGTYVSVIVLRIAYEVNPLMAALINFNPLVFLVFKFVVGTGCIVLLSKHQGRYRLARYFLYFTAFVYAVIMFIHVHNFVRYFLWLLNH